MIRSMTGYGRGEYKDNNTSFVVEMKSVNHRYSDIIIRMPKKFSSLEERIRQLIKLHIKRGRVEVYINYESQEEDNILIKPNMDLVNQYYNSIKEIKNNLNLPTEIKVDSLINLPNVFELEEKEENLEDIWRLLEISTKEALDKLIQMRESEGLKLSKDIEKRSHYIYDIVKKIEKKAPIVIKEYRDKLIERISNLTEDAIEVDENRLALEVSIYADKSNITEEVVRLFSHIEQLNKTINEEGVIGRKLDFLIQEMNREINTIGSKSSDIEISNLVIEVKSELEKIREQVQNIE